MVSMGIKPPANHSSIHRPMFLHFAFKKSSLREPYYLVGLQDSTQYFGVLGQGE
jgi:hypothetical protein